MARYKVLKSVAHNFGHSFTSLMNYWDADCVMAHLLRRAREVHEATLHVDILTGEAGPGALLTRPVRASLAHYRGWFPQMVAAQGASPQAVRAARMTLAFDLTTRRRGRHAPDCFESPYVCRVEIEDDRGKVWAAELRDWWCPEPFDAGSSPSSVWRELWARVAGRLARILRARRQRRDDRSGRPA